MKKIGLFKSYMSFRSAWNVFILLIKSNHGVYIGEGPQVKAFEKEFGEKFNLENVSAVNSGSSALELAYELVGISDGDEVITPVLTHPSTSLPAVRRGAKIVFADIDSDLNISVQDIKNKITTKTKAIVFVHFGGNNRGLKELLQIAKEKNLSLIEDAAQAVGTDFWGKADFTCISLQAIKTLTSGDGGFLISKDINLHEKGKRLRWFGYDRKQKYKLGDTNLTEAGYKYHMNDITASIGRGNLKSIDKIIFHRKKLMAEYEKNGVKASIWFAHTFSNKRDELIKFMKENGVHTDVYYWRNDKHDIFGGKSSKLPNMDKLDNQYLLLPLHQGMNVKDVRNICKLIKNFNEISKS